MAERGLRQRDVASILGISQNAVSRRVSGEIAFNVDELAALAAALDVPAPRLMDGVA